MISLVNQAAIPTPANASVLLIPEWRVKKEKKANECKDAGTEVGNTKMSPLFLHFIFSISADLAGKRPALLQTM